MALAYFKARRVADLLESQAESNDLVIGADTLCVHGNATLGQPKDEADASEMIKRMVDTTHRTLTGVCLLEMSSFRRMLFWDASVVEMGPLSDEAIETYIASGQWRGKAGAYNLSERLEAGWPITCRGDPATVMGLPMRKLPEWLDRFGIAC
jgi:septum formation protein